VNIWLVIATVALLAFALLPVLDRSSGADSRITGLRSYWIRLAHWTQG
jgi:hypothetical protein